MDFQQMQRHVSASFVYTTPACAEEHQIIKRHLIGETEISPKSYRKLTETHDDVRRRMRAREVEHEMIRRHCVNGIERELMHRERNYKVYIESKTKILYNYCNKTMK
ncbi:hypothetical protein PV325_004732, partial [Microctonus aethiopoides]